MIKNILISFSIIIFLNTYSLGQWITLDEYSMPNAKPVVTLVSDDETSSVIKVDLPGFQIDEFTADGKNYHSINIDEEAITTQVGYPEIPHFAKVLAIPNQGTVSIEVLETSEIHTISNISLAPARESWIEGKPETPYVENSEVYNSDEIYPSQLAMVEDPVIFRDFRIARVSVFPIRYSPSKKEIQAVSSITIKINYKPGIGVNTKTTSLKPIAPSFAKLYRNFIFNYEEVLQRKYGGEETGYDFMLCIMPDEFVTSFQTYADWKHKVGTYIHVTKFSDIGATGNNPTAVKNHITEAYNTWEVPPTHVLLVGDAGIAPVKYITYDYTFVYDDYFVEIEGDDYFPEMMIGRFTNQGDYRMQVMINKFLGYEKTPYVLETDWFKKGLVCSNNAYISQIYTKRFTAQEMLEKGNFISVDSMYNGYPCPGNVSTVVNMINNGRSFLNYRGEGWSIGWWASCFPFHTSDVSSLNNGQKLPFVTSIGCGVAMFDASGGNCFGEEWVQLGTPTDPRGACAFVGPTSNTHTTYNNKIDMGLYIGMFEEGMDSPGEALLRGKLYMFMVFGNTYWVEYHYRVYHVLGDASLHVWKDVPSSVTVTHPETVYVGYSQVLVNVKHSDFGLPVPGAQICISGDNIYSVEYTDASGNAVIDLSPESTGIMHITVRGGTVIPYEGVIHIEQGVENIAPIGEPVVTDTNGNLDGLINPNENCSITFTLKNYGTLLASSVSATLTVPDTITQVQVLSTTPVDFGDMAPNQSVTGTPFQFLIEPECPVGFIIPFELNVSSSTSNWIYFQNEIVHGCQLEMNSYVVDDEGNVLRNYRMDPGETVKVMLEIRNTGDDIAPDVKGLLRSDDEFITILDSIGNFSSLDPDSSAMNNSDYFIVQVSGTCPPQYNAIYSVELSTQNGLYPYLTVDEFEIPVAMPSGYDYTGPDAYGYYAYSNDDVLFQQSPQFNWAEINSIGNQITVPNSGNYTQTVNLPFNFKYYGNNFSQVRISTDGWIALGSGTQVSPENYPIPRQDDINNMVCPFWDDFFSTSAFDSGKIFYHNDVSNHRFIVEWFKVSHTNDYTNVETFQILILDPAYYLTPTGDGEIIMQYKTVEEPGSCTIGIEDNTETRGIQYVFDDIYAITATEIRENYAIKFTTNPPTVVSIEDGNKISALPTDYVLEQNYPNPFNPATRINYSIPEPAVVKLCVYDINGTLVKVLELGNKSAGRYEVMWDGINNSGSKVGSGVYFYKLQANSFVQVKKMILLK